MNTIGQNGERGIMNSSVEFSEEEIKLLRAFVDFLNAVLYSRYFGYDFRDNSLYEFVEKLENAIGVELL